MFEGITMIHSRRRFFAVTGTAALGAMLAACGSKSTSTATASATASATIAGAYDNLSGELKWTKFVPGHGASAISSTDPTTGEVYTIEPTAGPASVDAKASSVPIPIEDETMYDKNARGLRATFAYFAAAVNYARTTGDTGPALQVVHPDNAPQRASLEKLRAFYAPGTNWLVDGGWTYRLTEKQPVTRGTKYSWACSVTQEHGLVVEKATNTTKPLENTEAQDITALYAEYDEEAKRWTVISAQQYDPSMTPKPMHTSRPQPSSTYTPTVTDDSTAAAHTGSGSNAGSGANAGGSARSGANTGAQNGAANTGAQNGGAQNAPAQNVATPAAPAGQQSAEAPAQQNPAQQNPTQQNPAAPTAGGAADHPAGDAAAANPAAAEAPATR
jgi:outer membrane receptor protein